MKLSEKIAKLRKSHGMSQEQLASHLDVTRQTVYKWEAGINAPELEKIKIIAKMFDVSCDTLLDDERNLEEDIQAPKAAPSAAPQKSRVNKGLLIALISVVAAIHIVLTIIIVVFVSQRVSEAMQSPESVECKHESPYVASQIIKEATYTQSGTKRFLCPDCNKYYNEEYYLSYNVSVTAIERKLGTEIVALLRSEGYTEKVTVTLTVGGVVLAAKEIDIEDRELVTVVFSADKSAGQNGEIVVPLENEIPDRATATVSINTSMDKNLQDNSDTSEYIYPQNAKILYISTHIREENGTKSCESVLGAALMTLDISITDDNMFTSPDKVPSYEGYDLVIFENVAPSALPQSTPVWLLNPPNMPSGTGIVMDSQIKTVENYGLNTNNLHKHTSSPFFAIEFEPMWIYAAGGGITVYPSVKTYRAISSFAGYDKAYTAGGDTVMVAGELNGQKIIVSSFDFKDTSLSAFPTEFPSLVRNMIVYSIVNGTYSIE